MEVLIIARDSTGHSEKNAKRTINLTRGIPWRGMLPQFLGHRRRNQGLLSRFLVNMHTHASCIDLPPIMLPPSDKSETFSWGSCNH